jgi:predicted RNA methylase
MMSNLLESVLRFVLGLEHRLMLWLKRRLQARPLIGRVYDRIILEMKNREHFTEMLVHERLLADRARTDAYHRAIARYVAPNDTVIELGTGSGILSLFAARRGARKILAIDHSDIIDVASRVAEANGLSRISFIKTRSKQLRLPERVDVIIHEQIGKYVFDEQLLANITDLRDRLLKPSGRILPSRFEVFFEATKLREKYRVPLMWEQDIHGVDFASLRPWYERTVDRGTRMHVRPEHIDYLLCQPEKVLEFDLMTAREEDFPRTISYSRSVVKSGRLDGFCLYFRALFDDEIVFGNSPGDETTDWMVPFFRTPSRDCASGQTIEFALSMVELTAPEKWRWSGNVK